MNNQSIEKTLSANSQYKHKKPQINGTIHLEKYQFNLRNKLEINNPLGETYKGLKTQEPNNEAFIQVLSKPFQNVTNEEVDKLIQEIERQFVISQRWKIEHVDGGKAKALNQNFNQWTKKSYMILQLTQKTDFRAINTIDDVSQIAEIISKNTTIQICGGKYQLSSQQYFAKGGQGYIYKGFQTANTKNQVVIKIISRKFQDFDQKKMQKLNRQLNIMKHLNPKYAVRLLDQGLAQAIDHNQKKTQLKFLVMELMDGTLQKLQKEILKPKMEQNKNQGMTLVLQYFHKILRAYSACYENNIAHKDLKPQNILIKNKQIQGEYEVKIADFGLSIHQTTKQIKEKAGSLHYQSPQQSTGKLYTYKCDIYAFGGILIYLILGESPLDAEIIQKWKKKADPNDQQTKRLRAKTLQNIQNKLKDYDKDSSISKFIQKCLCYKQEDRDQYDKMLTDNIFNGNKQINNDNQLINQNLLNELGVILRKKGSYNKALIYLTKALQIIQKSKGVGSIETAFTLNNIGQVYNDLEDYENALKYYQQCLQIQKKIKGEGSIDTALTLNNIGSVYHGLGDQKNALTYFEQCLKIQKNIKGQGSIDTAPTLNNIGSVYSNKGDYLNALKYYEQCLQIQKRIKGKENINVALTLGNIGSLYCLLQVYESALTYYKQCLEIQKKIKGEGSIDTASTLGNIGSVYHGLGDQKNALIYFEQCLKIQKNVKGQGSIDTALTLNNIGNLNYFLGDYQNALKYFKQCLEIQKKIKGKQSIDTALTLDNIGHVYKSLKDYKNSLIYFEQSLEVKNKIKGQGRIDTASTLKNIAQVYSLLRNFKNALKYYEYYLEIQKQINGGQSIGVRLLEYYKIALKNQEQSLAIQEKKQQESVSQKLLFKESIEQPTQKLTFEMSADQTQVSKNQEQNNGKIIQ